MSEVFYCTSSGILKSTRNYVQFSEFKEDNKVNCSGWWHQRIDRYCLFEIVRCAGVYLFYLFSSKGQDNVQSKTYRVFLKTYLSNFTQHLLLVWRVFVAIAVQVHSDSCPLPGITESLNVFPFTTTSSIRWLIFLVNSFYLCIFQEVTKTLLRLEGLVLFLSDAGYNRKTKRYHKTWNLVLWKGLGGGGVVTAK